MRSSALPVCRSRRSRSFAIAVSAAFSPAACPPTPSITMKMPRCGSEWQRSSLCSRSSPGSLSSAARIVFTTRMVSPDRVRPRPTIAGRRRRPREERERRSGGKAARSWLRRGLEIEIHDAGQTDARAIAERRLDTILPLAAVRLVVASRHGPAVNGRAERAQIDQEEAPGRGIATDARMLAGHIDGALDPHIDAIRNPAAPNHGGVLGDLERMGTIIVGIRE